MRRLQKSMAVFVLCALLLTGCFSFRTQPKMEEAASFRMDTWITQRWYGENAWLTCDEIDDALREIEERFSLYLDSSEISKINDAAGKEFVPVSDEVYQLLKRGVQFCAESGGLFDLTVAPLSTLWNVTGDSPSVPPQEEIDLAREKVDYKKLLFDDETTSVMLAEEGMRLDLGGAAKGFAAGKMREIAQKNQVSGFLSVGGNMLVVGKKPDGTDFLIGVRDPRGDASSYFATVAIDGYTMATTGDYERYFEEDGVRYHHVIDPMTGYPSQTDLISVTVISEDGLLADCLSTSIFLQGSAALSSYLERTDCMVLAVTASYEVYASPALRERMTMAADSPYTLCDSFP